MTLRLTERQKEVLLLKCRDGLTHEQIGESLFISTQTAKNTTYDATVANRMSAHEIGWQLSREELFDELARRVLPGSPDHFGSAGCSASEEEEMMEVAKCTSA